MPTLQKLTAPDSDSILNAFLEYTTEGGLELYDHQEEAILEIFAGRNVILNTPTGSGKTIVALALQFQSWCHGRKSYYTVPIKALANEKFLALCKTFGAESVGLMTGDATVNPSAPIICCTAEILSILALRLGNRAQIDDVIMDEFHYYSDRERGVSWQLPLLTLSQSRFLLMSATFGDTIFFRKQVEKLTGVETLVVRSDDRPVPLEFSYCENKLEEHVAELAEQGKAPIYLVHFTQLACARTAQNLLSCNFCTREEKQTISSELVNSRFNSPYGKELNHLLRHGIGIHHAGLLPRYRILVEKLTQKGLLKVICGTDTLGVGVNVPIRTVVFTQLCKFDGEGTRILSVRDFKQICGRAGRRGFDDLGYVVAQAPEHVVENLKLKAKAQQKNRKVVLRKPPEKGFVHWDQSTFEKLVQSPPESLVSSFVLQPSLLLNVLGRQEEDGCAAMRRLIHDCHEPDTRKRALRRRSWQIFRNLVEGKVLSIIPPSERGDARKLKVNVDLQQDFSINQALGLWLLDTLPKLDAEKPEHVFQVLSLVEAILENPAIILRKQVDKLKTELIADLKADGVAYEERIEQLDEVDYPKPGADFIYDTFNEFVVKYPWVEREFIRPKSIAREMFENYQSFEDYIKSYKLERSEGVLLRHLSEVYRVLVHTVPDQLKTEELREAEEFFGAVLRDTDSSLLEEWENLLHPDLLAERQANATAETRPETPPFTRNRPQFERAVRRALLDLVKSISQGDFATASRACRNSDDWPEESLKSRIDAFLEGHERIRLDPEARARHHCHIDSSNSRRWTIQQTLVDPESFNDWYLEVEIDLDTSDSAQTVVFDLRSIAPY